MRRTHLHYCASCGDVLHRCDAAGLADDTTRKHSTAQTDRLPSRICRIADAAHMLGVSESQVRKIVRAGVLQVVRPDQTNRASRLITAQVAALADRWIAEAGRDHGHDGKVD